MQIPVPAIQDAALIRPIGRRRLSGRLNSA
jgi:hypothetical protein